MEVVPWVEKYRPKTLEDVAAHKDIVDTGKEETNQNHLSIYSVRRDHTIQQLTSLSLCPSYTHTHTHTNKQK